MKRFKLSDFLGKEKQKKKPQALDFNPQKSPAYEPEYVCCLKRCFLFLAVIARTYLEKHI